MGRARKEPEAEAGAAEQAAVEEAAEPAVEEQPAAEATPAPASGEKEAPRKPRASRAKAEKPAKESGASAKRAAAKRKPIVRTQKPERPRGKPKERRGTVVSSAMDKTIVVRVDTARLHADYRKVVRRSRKLHAHDPGNEAKVGDVVRIVETRPLSKTKTWRLAEVLEAAR